MCLVKRLGGSSEGGTGGLREEQERQSQPWAQQPESGSWLAAKLVLRKSEEEEQQEKGEAEALEGHVSNAVPQVGMEEPDGSPVWKI